MCDANFRAHFTGRKFWTRITPLLSTYKPLAPTGIYVYIRYRIAPAVQLPPLWACDAPAPEKTLCRARVYAPTETSWTQIARPETRRRGHVVTAVCEHAWVGAA